MAIYTALKQTNTEPIKDTNYYAVQDAIFEGIRTPFNRAYQNAVATRNAATLY